ncbi:MAG: class I SAM-dependent methyltransferase [Candidatus Latescibacterota bacterium]|nr:MAG: class I SAM-dependent methyltransferase [Candidatus Latescibacterota bacterium]
MRSRVAIAVFDDVVYFVSGEPRILRGTLTSLLEISVGKLDRQTHWSKVWAKYRENEVSWFQETPSLSLELIQRHTVDKNVRILDVGGGSSRLVDNLLTSGFVNVGVLDIAAPALEAARTRLGDRASSVEWVVGDVTAYEPLRPWDVWHDRAVFHFLVNAGEQQSYVHSLRRSITPAGVVVIATFGPEGPKRCSGLDVKRRSPDTLGEVFGSDFVLLESHYEIHRTPDGKDQQYVYCVFRRDMKRD